MAILFFCQFYIIDNDCVKYEHPPSNNKIGVGITSNKEDVQYIDLDLCLDCHIGNLKHLTSSKHHGQSLCFVGPLK